jgi:hypothetical protein
MCTREGKNYDGECKCAVVDGKRYAHQICMVFHDRAAVGFINALGEFIDGPWHGRWSGEEYKMLDEKIARMGAAPDDHPMLGYPKPSSATDESEAKAGYNESGRRTFEARPLPAASAPTPTIAELLSRGGGWQADHAASGWRHRAWLEHAEVLVYSAEVPSGSCPWEIRPKGIGHTTCQGSERTFEEAKVRALLVYEALFSTEKK